MEPMPNEGKGKQRKMSVKNKRHGSSCRRWGRRRLDTKPMHDRAHNLNFDWFKLWHTVDPPLRTASVFSKDNELDRRGHLRSARDQSAEGVRQSTAMRRRRYGSPSSSASPGPFLLSACAVAHGCSPGDCDDMV